jgi:hypothetical protein
MDDIARLLLKLFCLPHPAPGPLTISSPVLVLLPMKALINDILPGVLTSAQVDEIAQLGLQITTAREEVPASLHRMQRVSEIISNQLTDGASMRVLDKDRLKPIEQAFDFLLMLNHALTSKSILSIDLHSTQIAPFRYVESLRIDPNQGDPLISFVGPLPHSLGQSSSQADLTDADRSIIDKTDIIYYSHTPIPHLNVRGRCRWSSGQRLDLNPSDVPQRPFPSGDLDVFNLVGKHVGWIRTRSINLPHTISGKQLRLTIPQQPDAVVFETSLFDHDGKLSARSLRLFQASEGDTHF